MTTLLCLRCIAPTSLALACLALLAAAPATVGTPTRELDDQGFRVRLDLSRQILKLSIPEDRGFGEDRSAAEPRLVPTLPVEEGGIVSGSILAQKAKQFDDGLYAAVELAAQAGAGRFAGKSAMLQAVARGLTASGPFGSESPPAIVLAACRLGNVPAAIPPPGLPAVQSTESTFLTDPLRSRPIGFYTWSPALGSIFRQDRMLQSEFQGRGGIEAVVRALHSDAQARATYDAYETLVSRMTNPQATADLRGLLAQLDRGPLSAPDKGLAFFAPSRAHETDLIKKLYGNRPIPDGFSLVDELVRRIRAGQIDLRPKPESGWYDRQTWALEPLVIPERMPEAPHLQTDETYRKQLRELFQGILALTRETHIKQLEIPPAAAAAPFGPGPRPVIITVRPELTAEPLVTHYRRRGESYRFLRSVLTEAFGAEALRQIRRLTATGPVATDLLAELEQMEGIFLGASATAGRQLGMAGEADSEETFRRWSLAMASDPDLSKDVRMIVPVFFDRGRGKTRAWAFLGWTARPLEVDFARPPAAEVLKEGRKIAEGQAEVHFDGRWYSLAYPVTAEVYVSEILNRDEFRKHCDRYKTRAAILQNLR